MKKVITVAARESSLSRKQVEEVYKEFLLHYPEAIFKTLFMKTSGDLDLTTSLLNMDKTDFFTKEIDSQVLEKKADIGIHSAKDLADPLAQGLKIFAVTKGVASHDSLVLPEGVSLKTLIFGARIGTSSKRRQELVKELRLDLNPVDIRGTILDRLKLLDEKKIDGLIVAHAALIRLELLDLNWYPLEHETAPLQGRLAVVGRETDKELHRLFHVLDYQR